MHAELSAEAILRILFCEQLEISVVGRREFLWIVIDSYRSFPACGNFCQADTSVEVEQKESDLPTLETQISVAGVTNSESQSAVVHPVEEIRYDPLVLNPWPNPEVEKLLEREYRVATISWTDASPAGTLLAEIRFPEALFAQTILHQRLQYFKYYRTGVKVRVEVLSPATQGGCISVTPAPFHYSGLSPVRYKMPGQRAQTTGYAQISASGGGSYEFVLPWKAPQPFAHMAYCGVNPSPGPGERGITGTVYIYVVAPLEMPGASVSPARISVFASVQDLSLAGLSPLTGMPLPVMVGTVGGSGDTKPLVLFGSSKQSADSHAQSKKEKGGGTKHEAEARSEKGVISSLAKAGAGVLGTIAEIPGLEPLAMGAGVLGMVSKGAEMLGLDQPASMQAIQPTFPQGRTAHTHGLSPAAQIAETPGAAAGSIEQIFPTTEKNPSFLEIAMRPGILQVFTFDTTAAVDSQLSAWPVHPMLFPTFTSGASTCADPHPLAVVTGAFRFWRGGLRYRINFYAPALTTARVRIVFLPDSNAPPASIESFGGDVVSKLVEIRGDTVVEFTIPFLYERLYSQVASVADQTTSTLMLGPGTVGSTYITGYIAIYLVAPVATYDSSASFITAQVWIAADSDYQLFHYVGRYGTVRGLSMPALDAPKEATSPKVDKERKQEFSFGRSKSPATDFAQASVTVAVPQDAFKKEFPTFLPARRFKDEKVASCDPPSSPHVLARRFVPFYSSGGANIGGLTSLTIPSTNNVTGGSVRWVFNDASYAWIHWILACFRGHRGGWRVSIDWSGSATVSPQLAQPVRAFTLSRVNGLPYSAEMTDKFPAMIAELPWEEVNFYQQPHVENLIVGGSDLLPETLYRFRITCTAADTDICVIMDGSAADDLQLIDWLPPLPTLAV